MGLPASCSRAFERASATPTGESLDFEKIALVASAGVRTRGRAFGGSCGSHKLGRGVCEPFVEIGDGLRSCWLRLVNGKAALCPDTHA
jgi:hypothetical protein